MTDATPLPGTTGRMPALGTRWEHRQLRGAWTVATVGPKWVTLTSATPGVGPIRAPVAAWPMHMLGAWRPA